MAEIKVTINAKGIITGVDEVNKGLKGVSDNAKKTSDDLKKAFKVDVTAAIPGLKDAKNAIGSISDAFSSAKTVIAGGLIGGAVIAGLREVVDSAQKFENALIGLKSVARATGQDVDAVALAAKDLASDGLVPLNQVASSLKSLLASGLNLEQSVKLFNALKDSAAFNRQGFLGLGEAIEGAAQGIKNGNSILVDNAGITKNLSVLQKEYAASIGTTVGKLTEAQKIQAAYVGILKEAAIFSGDAAKLSDTYSGATARLGAAYDRLTASLGSFITQSSVIKSLVAGTATFFNNVAESFEKQTPEKRIQAIRSQLAGFLKDVESSPYKTKLLEELAVLEKQTAEQKKIAQASQEKITAERNAKTAAEELAKTNAESAAKQLKAIEKLKEKYKDAGLSELQRLQRVRDEDLKAAGNNADLKLLIERKYYDEVAKLEQRNANEAIKNANELNRLRKEAFQVLGTKAANPFAEINRPDFGGNRALEQEFNQRQTIGTVAGGLNLVAGGAEGAKSLVTGVAGLAIDSFVPGLGQALQPLLGALTAGPEATRQMVKDFAAAIPDLVEALIDAIPVLIEELANQAPIIIERLAEKAPDIITRLVKAAPRIIFKLVENAPKFIFAMVKGAPQIIGAIIKGVPNLIGALIGGIVNGVGRIVGAFVNAIISGAGKIVSGIYNAIVKAFTGFADFVLGLLGLGKKNSLSKKPGTQSNDIVAFATTGPTGDSKINAGLNVITLGGSGVATNVYNEGKKFFKRLGFASGGEVSSVRGGLPFQDSVPANLMAGEVVVDRVTTDKLKRFLDGGDGATSAMMGQIAKMLAMPMTVESSLELNQREFANIILTLNRTNQRLNA